MTFLPIVARELRVAARRGSTYWTRLPLACGALLVGAVIYIAAIGVSPQLTGQFIFQGLSWLCLLYCLFSGRRWTADCLSEEKREGTLGLLFLTDLRGYDVVLGKVVATSLAGFYGLLAVFPVLAIPLLLGGITSGEFWRIVLVLVNTFLLSLAVGVFGSALSRDFRHAMAANFFWLLLLVAAGPACAGAIAYFTNPYRFVPELLFSCPAYALYLAGDSLYILRSEQFWWSMGIIHGLTWLLLLLASWIAPHSWRDQPARAGTRRWRNFWRACSYGRAAPRQAFRKRLLDLNAFYWLAARARLKPAQVWIFLGLMAVWWLVGWIATGEAWRDEAIAITAALLLNTTFKVWLVIEAGQRLAEDQRSGALELLLSSPLSVGDILRGQMLALRRQFLWPLLVVLAVEVGLMCQVNRHTNEPTVTPLWIYGMLMLLADLVALSWVALASALTAKNQNQATLRTLSRVLSLPWLVGGVVVLIGLFWYGLVLGKEWSPDSNFYLRLWFWLGLGADLGFGLWAWRRLRTRFRQLALQRYEPKPQRRLWRLGPAKVATAAAAGSQAPRHEPQAKRPPKRTGALRKTAVLAGVALLAIVAGVAFFAHRAPPGFPAPVNVTLQHTNTPVRVAPAPNGAFLILPDGSLWHWGQPAKQAPELGTAPEQVGTNCDWVQAAGTPALCVGLRSDGTIWEWGRRGRARSDTPRQVDPGHDWIGVAATAWNAVALRRDGSLWAWGDDNPGQAAWGSTLTWTNLAQVGNDQDWAAVSGQWTASLGVRQDGSLWVWGTVFTFGGNPSGPNTYPIPTRVCRETNWVGFATGFQTLARTRSGELWEPLNSPPNAEASAASTCRLAASNALPDHVALAYCGTGLLYELRPDGTLWKKDAPLRFQPPTVSTAKWRRVGRRSDWLLIWGAGGTAFGLTPDGTLWTWGVDPSQTRRSRLCFEGRAGPTPAKDLILGQAIPGPIATHSRLSKGAAAPDAPAVCPVR